MGGLNPDFTPANVYNLVADNIRLHELKSNRDDANHYGVDYLYEEK
jgi:hypothetical protein